MPTYYFFYPMHIYLITSKWKEKANVMTACWVVPLSDDPDLVGVSIWKENFSWSLIKNSGYFGVNATCEGMEKAAWICGTETGKEINKFEEANLEIENGKYVPLIKQSPYSLECKVVKAVEAGDHTFFIGEVVNKIKRFPFPQLLHGGGRNIFPQRIDDKVLRYLFSRL